MSRRLSRIFSIAGSLLAAATWAGTAQAADPVTASSPAKCKPRALVVLPPDCNTTDGMCLLPDRSFLISIPNFNDEKSPPLMMRITPQNKAEVFYEFPTPYPGLRSAGHRIAPMGISRAPSATCTWPTCST